MSVGVRDILKAGSEMAGIDLRGRDKTRAVCMIRNAAYYAARDLTGRSYPMIGRMFWRDHTTIISGAQRADPEIVERISKRVGERVNGA